jgi:predicted GNAT family acetyltransferase
MEIVNNKQQSRFEIALPDGEYAVLEYRWLKGSIVLMHTLVPQSAQGKGIGSTLVKGVFEYIQEQGLNKIVYCPFVTRYIKAHGPA